MWGRWLYWGHLGKGLIANGVKVVRAADIKPLAEWYQEADGVENLTLDLKNYDNCLPATEDVELVYQLAPYMAGKSTWRHFRLAFKAVFTKSVDDGCSIGLQNNGI